MNRFQDPYAIRDKWLKFEDEYETYLKHVVWVSDGEEVESVSFYKCEPYSIGMENGKNAKYWMLPSKEITDSTTKPLPPMAVKKED